MWYCGPVILSPTPPPIIPKLLLLGDSMIAATYVPVDLPPLLKSAGIPVIFIGDKIYPGNHIPTDGFSGFDTGTMLTQLTSGTVWKEANGTTYPNNFVNNIPDIVIIQLGTNDLIKPSAYQGDMQSIITFLHSKNQNVKIVVSKLIPSKNSASDNQIQLLNNAIPGFVQSMNSKYPPVVTTQDLRSIWKPEDFADDYHPSMTGSQKMAQSYYDALLANGFVSK
jgi:lysophospholipase L1-like esterase